MKYECFNPLEIGSFCNPIVKMEVSTYNVSIPLKSGHFVIITIVRREDMELFQSP